MTEICCICQEETTAFMSVSQTKVGTPPILIKDILLECWSQDKLPSGILKNEDDSVSSICSYCQFILLEFYEATICVEVKRNELQKRFKDPKQPEPPTKWDMDAKKVEDSSDEDFDADWSPFKDSKQTEVQNKWTLEAKNVEDNSDEDFDADWSDGSWAEEERVKKETLSNDEPQLDLDENEPLSTVRDKLQAQKANRYCRECEVECPSEEVFMLHMKKYHPTDISNRTCSLCKLDFPSNDEHRVHMLEVHQRGSKFHCDKCERSFNTHTLLVAHIATHKPHTCTICGKTLAYRRGLLRHMETHNTEKRHQCPECGNKYTTRGSLKQHMMTHSDECPKDSSGFICDQCGKTLYTAKGFKTHRLRHNPVKEFECPECGERYHLKINLKHHMAWHTGEKPFQCDICQKRFVHRVALYRHKQIHDNETRRIECKECSFKFRTNAHLQRHMMTHTGAKPFSCPICGKCFAQLYNMKSHVQEHEHPGSRRQRRFKCKKCSRTFTNNKNFEEHCQSLECEAAE